MKELNATSENKDICIHYVFKVSENMPVKDIKWTKNNSELEVPSDKYRGGGVADNCLTILRATDDDKGLYTCTVRNAVGAVSKSMELGTISFCVKFILHLILIKCLHSFCSKYSV